MWWTRPAFLRLWSGLFLSLLGDWSLRALLLVWVYSLTHSGAAVSLVGVAEFLPLLLVAPVAGAFVDRWHRAHTMTGVVLARAALVLPLLGVSSGAQLPQVLVVTVLVNVASQFFQPAAAASTPVVVGIEHLGYANSLLSYVNSTVGIVGPAAGALLFTTIGPHATVLVLCGIYLGAAPILAGIPAPRPAGHATSVGLVREIGDGVRYLARHRILRFLVLNAFIFCLGAGTLSVLDVLFISRVLHLHTQMVSTLYAISGCGALVGSTVLTMVGPRIAGRYHLVMGWFSLLQGCAVVLYALAPTLAVALVAVAMVGFCFTLAVTSYITIIQLATPDALMGRVLSVCNMTVAAGLICSLTFGGVLADRFGVRQVAGTCAAMIVLAATLSLLLVRETPVRSEQAPSAAPSDVPAVASGDIVALGWSVE